MANFSPGQRDIIFLSYRRKDTKAGSRVNEFFKALKTGITSKFKDGIGICYTVYQRNVSSETHVLNASLKRKLKCMAYSPLKKNQFR
jgi:hypothetical protein